MSFRNCSKRSNTRRGELLFGVLTRTTETRARIRVAPFSVGATRAATKVRYSAIAPDSLPAKRASQPSARARQLTPANPDTTPPATQPTPGIGMTEIASLAPASSARPSPGEVLQQGLSDHLAELVAGLGTVSREELAIDVGLALGPAVDHAHAQRRQVLTLEPGEPPW